LCLPSKNAISSFSLTDPRFKSGKPVQRFFHYIVSFKLLFVIITVLLGGFFL
jgi:hypothetical protein